MRHKSATTSKSIPRKKQPRKLNTWAQESVANATAECLAAKEQGKECGIRRAARAYGVPQRTLERQVNGKVTGSKHASGRHGRTHPLYC